MFSKLLSPVTLLADMHIVLKSLFVSTILCLSILLALHVDIKMNKKEFTSRNYTLGNILIKPYNFYKYSFWISLFWSLIFIFIVLLVIEIAFFNTNIIKEEHITGYIIGIVASFFIGFWSLLIAFVIRSQQRTDFSGMEKFIWNLADIFHTWYSKEGRNHGNKKLVRRELFLLDYHPLIGSISLSHELGGCYNTYKDDLKNLKNKPVNIRIICYDDSNCSEMFKVLKSLKPEIPNTYKCFEHVKSQNSFDKELIGFCEKFEKDSNNIAIWHTSKINPLHFVIADNKVYQYSVIPVENNGKRNVLMGYESEDVFQIEFLRSTFNAIERFAITPDIKINQDNSITLKFEKQINISKILFLHRDKKIIKSLNYSNSNSEIINNNEIKEGVLSEIIINKEYLTDKDFKGDFYFAIKLCKTNGVESVDSELIKIDFIEVVKNESK
jgi:hypothetical protein